MEYDNYIFDLDGTIINSQKDVFLCFAKAFEKANYKIDKSRLNPDVIGPPLKEIVKLIAPELNDEILIDKICKIFSISPLELLMNDSSNKEDVLLNINALLSSCSQAKLKKIYEIICLLTKF